MVNGTSAPNGGRNTPMRWPVGRRDFLILWIGEMVSLIGSAITRFALGVWVYEHTGSVTQFTLASVFSTLPGILLSPLAGVIIDRVDRRRLLIAVNLGHILAIGITAVLVATGELDVWHVYLLVTWMSLLNAFALPTMSAVTSLLVRAAQLGRANGLMQLGFSAAGAIAPMLGGLMWVWPGLEGVLVLDLVSFAVAVVLLTRIRIPAPPTSPEGGRERGTGAQELAIGWRFIREHRGLLGLVAFYAVTNLALSIVSVLTYPLILAFADTPTLGTVLTLSGFGLVLGSLFMTVTGGPKRKIHGILGHGLAMGLGMVLIAIQNAATTVALGLVIITFTNAIFHACSMTVWQVKVPADLQGRVFTIRRLVSQLSLPVGYLLAGPLADRVEPLMQPGGALASGWLGSVLGAGPGRGIALILLVLAPLPVISSLIGYTRPSIRDIETRLPDRTVDATAPAS